MMGGVAISKLEEGATLSTASLLMLQYEFVLIFLTALFLLIQIGEWNTRMIFHEESLQGAKTNSSFKL